MAAVIVNIAGRTYRLSCDDGEEPRLEQLARYVENKIFSMKEGFGEIGDQRLVVMAAIAIADEASDARSRAQAMETDLAALRSELDATKKAQAALEERVAQALADAASRLEQLNSDLQRPAAPKEELF
jgi:cell division protein ZapA